MLHHLQMLAKYNSWMNVKLYDGAETLTPVELRQLRGAFFGSLLGTLNHLLVGDTIWLFRFAEHPAKFPALQPLRAFPRPNALDQLLFTDIASMRGYRKQLDLIICRWTEELTEFDLDYPLKYANMKGVVSQKRLSSLALHFFNHQTHHRGQATTLLSQAGVDIGVTDLLALIPDAGA